MVDDICFTDSDDGLNALKLKSVKCHIPFAISMSYNAIFMSRSQLAVVDSEEVNRVASYAPHFLIFTGQLTPSQSSDHPNFFF